MKKFISALSSFVIAATAMGGSVVIPTEAATVTETIVALRSNNEKVVTAKAGDTIPVEVYIPQSSGFNSLLLKFAVGKDGNLDDTKGQGSVVDRNGTVIENYKDAFGNYGIKMVAKGDSIGGQATDFSYPNCLESGKTTDFSLDAGDVVDTGIAMFNTDAWSVLYQAKPEINAGVNVDAFGAWVAAGGKLEEDFDYSNYSPVTTWSADESWAYSYTFTKIDLKLPTDLPDGTYVFDVYKDVYINTHPGSLFDDDNNPLPDDKRGDAQSNFSGVDGTQKFSTEKLTILVGDTAATTAPAPETTAKPADTTAPAPETTAKPADTTAPAAETTAKPADTTAPAPETTAKPADTTVAQVLTEPIATQAPANAIIYNLIPHGKEYTSAEQNNLNYNIYNAEPGEAIQVDWTVRNDQGTAGIQMSFDFTQVEYVSGKRGAGYRVTPTYSDYKNTENMKKGEVIYTWAQSSEAKAADNSTIYSFNITAPETAGNYMIGLSEKPNEISKVVPKAQDQQHAFVMYGLKIVVGNPTVTDVTTEAKAETTAAEATTDAVTYTTGEATTVAATETQPATTAVIVNTTAAQPGTTAVVENTTAAQPGTTAVVENTTAAQPATTAVVVNTTAAQAGTTAVVVNTTAAQPTTTVAADPNAIIYNLIPHGKEYTSAETAGYMNNVYRGIPGEELTVDWTIKNDKGTAGIQMNFDFTQVEYISGKRGSAYRVTPTYSDSKNTETLKNGEIVYTWAQSTEAVAADNTVIYSFTVKLPSKDGTYSLGLSKNANDVNKVVPRHQENPHKFVFYGLDIVIGSDVTTEPAQTSFPGNQVGDTLYGDVNCDGAVRIGDVVLLNRYLAKNATVSPQGLLNADCEKDNKLDAKDSVKIKKYLALMIEAAELGKASN